MDEDFLKMEKVQQCRWHFKSESRDKLTDFLSVCVSVRVLQWSTLCWSSCCPKRQSSSNQIQVLRNATQLLSLTVNVYSNDFIWRFWSSRVPSWHHHLCVFTADRAKLSMLNTMSRIRGQGRSVGYPQTEGMLGDCMSHYGQELGAASEFGTMSVSTLPADNSQKWRKTWRETWKKSVILSFLIQTVTQLLWTTELNPHKHGQDTVR